MKLAKKFLITSILLSAGAFIFAQTSEVQTVGDYEEEASVDSAYLSDDYMGETITALAAADDLESKMSALQYVREALNSGNTSPAVIQGLNKLAGEGIKSQTRENGRVMNNYPEIRRDACHLLAQVPTKQSFNLLVSIGNEDLEPMVGAAAIYALGEIADDVDNVDGAVNAISFFNNKNWALNPTSSFASEVLIAYNKLKDKASPDMRNLMVSQLVKIANNYSYTSDVRTRAKLMLKEMSGSGSKKSNSGNSEVSEK